MPGLVNVHTHLELTHLAGSNGETAFPAWIRRVRELKDATTPDQFRAAAEQGLRDCWARGVTCVADTGSTGAAAAVIAGLGGRGIVYQEVFGPDPAKVSESLEELKLALQPLRLLASTRLRVGVSPHALYSVSAPLYSPLRCARAASRSSRDAARQCSSSGNWPSCNRERSASTASRSTTPTSRRSGTRASPSPIVRFRTGPTATARRRSPRFARRASRSASGPIPW
ncbi:MAG: hypothetical protein DMD29_13490 [Gemmatimonadetes bacterium]|nr:MAG: hypothetical protein DMD29_13490 [Gemmatimonadota bacterium]